ncbi:glycosyltransferase 87 family protein [Acidobacteriota bacterium]
MDSSTIIPIITTLIVLWVLNAAVNEFAARRKKKFHETLGKETPAGEVSPGLRLLHAFSTPFFLLARAWGKLGFAIMEGGCLLFTIITGLPLLILAGALTGGVLLAPGRIYAALSSGSISVGLLWTVLWLFCLTGMPGLLSGINAAYRGVSRGVFQRESGRSWLRCLLILTGIGFLLIPVSSRLFPGFLDGENASLSRGAEVNLTAGDKVESTGAAEPGSRPKAAGKNLLKNGDFEQLRGNKLLGWETDLYGPDKDSVRFSAARGGAFSGDHYVTIENAKANDGKFVQSVKVKPDTLYKLSCMVKAEGVGRKGKGANITVLSIFKTSRDVKDTSGKWNKIVLYGSTGPSQKEMAVSARLGGYGAVSIGKACFDDFRVEEVAEVPAGTKPVKLYQIKPEHHRPTEMPTIHAFMVSAPLLFLLLFLLAYYFIFNNRENELADAKLKHLELTFFIILSGSFALRLVLAPVIDGFSTDINTFKAWAGMAAHRGLGGFYSGEIQVDYPPGYIYILYLIGLLKKLFSLSFESKSFLMLIKMPAMIADMVTALIIYKLTRSALPGVEKSAPGKVIGSENKQFAVLTASVLSLFYALNPAVILNSTIWGQVDSFFTLFILLTLLLLFKDKFEWAAVVFVIAVLIKPQALIFTPVGIYAFIGRRSIMVFLRSLLLMMVTFVVLILPFAINRPPLWIFELYKNTLSSYPFASLNAFNLFALNGGNYARETDIFFVFSYQVWGYIFIAAIVVFSGILFFKSKDKSRVFFIALFIIAAVFILTSKMHERYLFPVLCLSLTGYIFTRDRRLLFIFAGFTLTHFINTALILDLVVRVGKDRFPPDNIWLYLISFINLALLAYTVQTGWDLYLRKPGSTSSGKSD